MPLRTEAFSLDALSFSVELDAPQPLMVRSTPVKLRVPLGGRQTTPVYWNLEKTTGSDSFRSVKS
jgi:hypothetical protein